MSNASAATQLLQAYVDENDESLFRVLIDGKHIKYVAIAAGVSTNNEMCFGPTFVALLPPFPKEPWNYASIERDPQSGSLHFATASIEQFPEIQTVWHPVQIEYLKLDLQEKLCSGVYLGTCADLPGQFVAKFARFDFEIYAIDRENECYSWIEGLDIGPKFYGHILEHGRPIGFLMEYIHPFRHAEVTDLDECITAAKRLHQQGILHGDLHRHNILMRNGQAVIIDYDSSKKSTSQLEFQNELDDLPRELAQKHHKGEQPELP